MAYHSAESLTVFLILLIPSYTDTGFITPFSLGMSLQTESSL